MKMLLATLWILTGLIVVGGLYWSFLITPVSTVVALLMSAVLAIVVLALIGLIANGAIEIWARGLSVAGVKRALRSIPAIVPAGLIVLLIWWITSRLELSVAQNSGPINAWFIARFGWDDISWLFTAIRTVATWLRWVVGGMLALSLMAGVLAVGWPAVAQFAWLRRALRPRAIVIATLSFVVLVALPWTFVVPWRPESLPPTSLETAFIVSKLGVVAVLFAAALALIVREATPPPAAPAPAAPSLPASVAP
ncbi:MAG TPA: hypothetical protein VEA16_06150 [Vicinamibacterales bacterium]|nr:hypothetical protein [Vicinamibacterales bacterium]